MPIVEIHGGQGEADKLLFKAEFDFLPRLGEYISKNAGGYFEYYLIVEVWHREKGKTGRFQACLGVKVKD